MTFVVTTEAECVIVFDPGDIVGEAVRLLLATIKRIVWSTEGKLRQVSPRSADKVTKAACAGAVIKEKRRVPDA